MVVIILCHNQIGYNQKLYKSILEAKDDRKDIIIVWVDNGSTDKASSEHLVQICKDNAEWFRYWHNEDNKIFTEACYEVIEEYKTQDIYLLNNDIEVMDGWLSGRELLNDYAMVGATQVHPLQRDLITFAGGKDDFAGHKVMYEWKEKELYGGKEHEEAWLTFGACMISRSAYDYVGGLNRNLRFYCSDSDLSMRMKINDFKICVSPKMRVAHWGGMTTKSIANNPMAMEGMEDQILFGETWGVDIGGYKFKPYDIKDKEKWFTEFFTKYPETEGRNKIVSKRYADKLNRMINVKGKKILELGCVWGNVVKELRGIGAEAYGVDILDISKGEFTDKFDIEKNGMPDMWGKEYDLITSTALFEHIPLEPVLLLLNQQYSYLKKGGIAYHEIDTEIGTDRTHININTPKFWIEIFEGLFTEVKYEITATGMLKIKAVK